MLYLILQEHVLTAGLLCNLLVFGELHLRLSQLLLRGLGLGLLGMQRRLQHRHPLLQVHPLSHQLLNQCIPTQEGVEQGKEEEMSASCSVGGD